jgi:hypothetical protein
MLERGNLKRLLRGHLAFANLGLFVTAVAPEASPSELALGDVLLSIDHHPVTGDPDLPAAALARVLDKVGMGVHQADIVRTSELRLMTLPVNVGLCPILR